MALNQRGEARDAARTADAQRLGLEALNQERLDQALLTASAAVELDESPATQSNLLSVLQRNPATLGAVDHDFGIFGAAISPDGKLMAIGDDIGNVVVYDAATRRPLGEPYRIETGIIQNVRFSPDGDTLAVSFMDRSVPELSAVFDLIDPRTASAGCVCGCRRSAGPRTSSSPTSCSCRTAATCSCGRCTALARTARQRRCISSTARPERSRIGCRWASTRPTSTRPRRPTAGMCSSRACATTGPGSSTPSALSVVRSWPVGDCAGAVSPDGRVFALGSEAGRSGCSISAPGGSGRSGAATTAACSGCASRPTDGRS